MSRSLRDEQRGGAGDSDIQAPRVVRIERGDAQDVGIDQNALESVHDTCGPRVVSRKAGAIT